MAHTTDTAPVSAPVIHRVAAAPALILSLLSIALAAINFPYGFAQDLDGYSVVTQSMRWAEQGYLRSRSWGFPAYDLVVYPLIYYGGTFYAKLYSLLFYVAASLLFFLLLRSLVKDRPDIAFFGALSFVVLPISVISGATILETSQSIFLALAGLYGFVRYWQERAPRQLYWTAALLGLATSTRPDYAILSLAAALVILLRLRPHLRQVLAASLLYLALALLPFAIYGNLYFGSNVLMPDPLTRKLIIAFFGILALWGLPAVLVLALFLTLNGRRLLAQGARLGQNPVILLFLIAVPLYLIRFCLLPDELEYIYILVPLTIMVLVQIAPNRPLFIILALAIALPNLVQLHLFQRDSDQNVVVNIGISPGALYQDRRIRLLNEYTRNELPALKQQVAEQLGQENFTGGVTLEKDALVIIAEEELRFYRPDRLGGAYYQAFDDLTVMVYPLPSSKGWRHFLKFEDWHEIGLDDFRRVDTPPGVTGG